MVVTRFAPSPTGYLHVGGARTALFNWLLARKTGGKFVLRIEDTDQKRNTPTAMQQVMDDLKWLGITWDEGPEAGGKNGPYLQSQRREIYQKYIQRLIDKKKAYYCFDTPQELDRMREKAAAEKKNFVYPRPERFPDENDVKKAIQQAKDVVVRFVMPDEQVTVEDVVRGQVNFDGRELGDFVIQKSDGFPTYNFAVVVDDELMGITHVIRGQEHLMNTPGQQALQDAMGFRRPVYAHMSVTVSEGGGKLSKRERPKALREAIKARPEADIKKLAGIGKISDDEMTDFLEGKMSPDMPAVDAMAEALGVHLPEINVVDFRNSGYLPEAIVNFLALLGWNPGDDREVMNVDEIIKAFDINRLTKSNSLFDRKKLISFNTEHMRMVGREKLVGYLKDYLCISRSVVPADDKELLERLIKINEGARTFVDIEQKSRFAFVENESIQYDEKAVKKVLLKHDGLAILKTIGERFAAIDEITPEKIEEVIRGLVQELQVGLGKVAQPLRVAICGTTISPSIFDSIDILGMENVLKRINIALAKYGQNNSLREV